MSGKAILIWYAQKIWLKIAYFFENFKNDDLFSKSYCLISTYEIKVKMMETMHFSMKKLL